MLLRVSTSILLIALSTIACYVSAQAADYKALPDDIRKRIMFVDIRDLNTFLSTTVPEAGIIQAELVKNPSRFLPEGVVFSQKGVTLEKNKAGKPDLEKSLDDSVYGVEFESLPVQSSQPNLMESHLIAFYHSKSTGDYNFVRFIVNTDASKKTVVEIIPGETIPVNKTNFEISVGIAERKLVLHEPEYNITKVYPLDVGAFDQGIRNSARVTKLMTPRYTDAVLKRTNVTSMRWDPAYYKGKPFMAISSGGERTAIAFHTTMEPGMERGFVSHGCMRVRDKDLYELFAILMMQQTPSINVAMNYYSGINIDHPMPYNNSTFETIKNFGTADNPKISRDDHGLTITTRVKVSSTVSLPKLPYDAPNSDLASTVGGLSGSSPIDEGADADENPN